MMDKQERQWTEVLPNTYDSGMTLRDYFAGQVLAGSCAMPGLTLSSDIVARACYEIADDMLAERETERDK